MKDLLSRLSRAFAGKHDSNVELPVAFADRPAVQMIDEAIALHRDGRLADAESLYRQVLALEPTNFDALHLLGVLAQQTGHSDIAIDFIGRAVAIRPDDPSAGNNLGLAFRALGRFVEAEAALRRAVELNPEWDRPHASLGLVLRDRGNPAGAEIELATALRLNPSNEEAMTNLANIHREARRFDEAEVLYRAALALRPDSIPIWTNLAALYQDRGRWKEAEDCLRSAIGHGDSTPEVMSNLCFALLQLDRLDEAQSAGRDSLARRPEYPDVLVNLAMVEKALWNLEGAEALCRSALAIDGTHVAAHVNLGTIRKERGDAADAEACYRRALALDAHSAPAQYHLALMQLMSGHYGEGFKLLESRLDSFPAYYGSEQAVRLLRDVARRWHGTPIDGRRVLVWTEQGHGDNLMMLRYLPLLKQHGAIHVTFACEPELARIAERIADVDAVIVRSTGEIPDDYELHCPTMSLPHCFQTTLATIPMGDSNIQVPSALSDQWKLRLAGIERPRIGLVWAGTQTHRDLAKRSLSLDAFEPLRMVSGVRFVSLQKGLGAEQAIQWGDALVDPMEHCADFMDTAALICNVDLVITIDTAVAHLAGAIGKAVWLINRAGSDWRWGLAGERTGWYPTMRIFRQEQPLEWAPVMQRVASELQAFAATRTSPCTPHQ